MPPFPSSIKSILESNIPLEPSVQLYPLERKSCLIIIKSRFALPAQIAILGVFVATTYFSFHSLSRGREWLRKRPLPPVHASRIRGISGFSGEETFFFFHDR